MRTVEDQHTYHLYNCRDTLNTLRSAKSMQQDQHFRQQRQVYAQEMALVPVALGMMRWGMLVNRDAAKAVRDTLWAQEQHCTRQMQELLAETDYTERGVGFLEAFKPGGHKTIRAALLAMGIPITKRTKTGLLATGQDILATVMPDCTAPAKKFISLLIKNSKGEDVDPAALGWRPCSKLRTTYLENLPILEDGRIHAGYLIHGTISGRFSSADPNMMNWPKWVRAVVVSPAGHKLVGADYSQVEVRIQAWLSGDQALLSSFDLEDSHKARAAMIFGVPYDQVTKQQRQLGKRFIYAMAYGAQWETIYNRLLPEYPGLEQAMVKVVFEKIQKAFPQWMRWRQRLLRDTKENGYAESAILGRRRLFLAGMKATEILNYPVQATAADIINEATLKIWKHLPGYWPNVHLVNQMHDSLTFEVPNEQAESFAAYLGEVMPGPFELRDVGKVTVPVDVKIGGNWAEV